MSAALLALVMFTPAIAAYIVRRFIAGEGFATAGLRRGPWRPYLLVWIGVPLLVAAIYAVTVLLGLGRFDPTLSQLTARMEEGFLLVRLLPLGRWRAALIYGALWGLWHAPIIVGGYNYPGYPVLGVIMMCALTNAFALTPTALRLRHDSVLLTSFFHANINTYGLGIIPMMVIGIWPVLGGITGIVGIVAFGALGAWLLARTPESLAERSISG